MLRESGTFVVALLVCACGSSSGGEQAAPGTNGSTSGGVTASGTPSSSSATATTASAAASTTTSANTTSVGAGGNPSSSATSAGADSSSSGAAGGGSNASTMGGAGGSGGDGNSSGTPREEELAPLPMSRQEHAVAALGGEVYVLGGFTDGPTVLTSVQAYTPETDEWRDVADFPAEFHHPNVAVVGGLLYVLGFHVGSGLREGDPRVFAYDPDANEWTPRSSLPAGTGRGTACVAALGSQVYLFGGASDVTMPDAHAYDTEADSWQQLPLMPALREHCLAAAFDGKIYIVSGRANSIEGIAPESFVYDPETRTFEERAAIPTARGGAAGGLLSGRIFVLGGEGNPDGVQGIFSEVEAYDPVTDSWESFPQMLIPRHGYGAAIIGDRMYLAGGGTSQGFQATANHTVFYFAGSD